MAETHILCDSCDDSDVPVHYSCITLYIQETNWCDCVVASVLSLALFCTPPPLCVLTKEEANGTETVSRVLMVEVNAICLW